jgi:formate dehydrogenase subunit delta
MDSARLIYMANQIARNLAAQGEAAAIAATAQHIRDFWDPRMTAAIMAVELDTLDPIAQAAIARLRPAP